MITPGWERRNNVCPQCHMPGRVWDRYTEALIKDDKVERGADSVFLRVAYQAIGMELHADFCDNCGVLYAYKAVNIPRSKVE